MDRLRRVQRKVQGLAYLEKWLVLGIIIGLIASVTAIAFITLLTMFMGFSAWILGVVDSPLEWGLGDFSLIALATENRLAIPLLVVIGALISGLIVYRFEPTAEGAGTNAAIRAYHRGAFMRFRVPIIKAIASALFLGFGGSGGVQGPGMQIGAGIGSSIARILKLNVEDRRLAIVAGMAATLSAIFRSPIGSALFAVEVLYRRDIETEALAPAIIASAISFVVSVYVLGYRGFFPQISVSISDVFQPLSLAMIFLLGFLSAAFARLYILIFTEVRRLFGSLEARLSPRYRWVKPVVGACIVGCIGLFIPVALGGGSIYAAKVIEKSIHGEVETIDILGLGLFASLTILLLFKVIATAFSVGSGGSGGLFAPSIFIGTLLGYLYGEAIASRITSLPPYVYAYIGMASFFGAATKTPIASSFMIAEMSGSYPLLIPALITSLIANELLRGRTLYEAQITRRVKPELIALSTLLEIVRTYAEARDLRVYHIVNEEYVPVTLDNPVSKAIEVMTRYRQKVIPVTDKDGAVRGAIDSATLRKALEEGLNVPLAFLELANPPLVRMDEPLSTAIEKMIHRGFDYAIAIDENGRYAGVLLAEDIAITLAHFIKESRTSM